MPIAVGDMIAGVMKGAAQGLRAAAGTEAVKESKGAVKTQDVTDEEFEQMKRLRDAQARKANG